MNYFRIRNRVHLEGCRYASSASAAAVSSPEGLDHCSLCWIEPPAIGATQAAYLEAIAASPWVGPSDAGAVRVVLILADDLDRISDALEASPGSSDITPLLGRRAYTASTLITASKALGLVSGIRGLIPSTPQKAEQPKPEDVNVDPLDALRNVVAFARADGAEDLNTADG